MRFRRGSMVEVLSKKKDLLGVWRCAQIVDDNGAAYTVRYYRCPGVTKEGVHKVPTEAIRPRPPSGTESSVWAVGDVVEVLDDGCWRVSMIEEVLEDDSYYIQVIGSVDEFKVMKSSIRGRQEWKENQWVPMGKDSGIDEKLISRMQMAQVQRQGDLMSRKDVQESVLLSKTLKRSSLGNLSIDKASQKCVKKRRAMDKEVKCRVVPDSYSYTGKADVPVITRESQGKDKLQISEKTTCSIETNLRDHLARAFVSDVCDSPKSSVGSCSIVDVDLDRLVSHSSASCRQDIDALCSDAKSFDQDEGDVEAMEVCQPKQENTLRVHKRELYSYRSTLEALYACGPLNWDLEAYLTNLRQKYCVSNDEHLMELRRLKSIRGPGLSCY